MTSSLHVHNIRCSKLILYYFVKRFFKQQPTKNCSDQSTTSEEETCEESFFPNTVYLDLEINLWFSTGKWHANACSSWSNIQNYLVLLQSGPQKARPPFKWHLLRSQLTNLCSYLRLYLHNLQSHHQVIRFIAIFELVEICYSYVNLLQLKRCHENKDDFD